MLLLLIAMNAAVLLLLAGVAWVAKVSGVGMCLAFLLGMLTFATWFRLKHGYWP